MSGTAPVPAMAGCAAHGKRYACHEWPRIYTFAIYIHHVAHSGNSYLFRVPLTAVSGFISMFLHYAVQNQHEFPGSSSLVGVQGNISRSILLHWLGGNR